MKCLPFTITKPLIGIFNLIKRMSCRLLNYVACYEYEEKKVLRQLLHDGEIDEATCEELCEECSNGKLTFDNIPIENEKLNKVIEKIC